MAKVFSFPLLLSIHVKESEEKQKYQHDLSMSRDGD